MDKVKSRTKLKTLVDNNRKITIRAEGTVFPMIALGNTDSPDVFRFVVHYNDIRNYTGVKRSLSTLPIGLVQVDIPYENINVIFEYDMDSDIFNNIPEEILEKYPHSAQDPNANPPCEHEYGEWEQILAPGCVTLGEEVRTCALNENHKEHRSIAALGHNWGNYVVTTPATCDTQGVETRICTRDNTHVITEPIPQLPHTITDWITTDANCEDTSHQVKKCSVCDTILEERDIILGHDWDEWKYETFNASFDDTEIENVRWIDITYGNGIFVTCNNVNNNIAYSLDDGKTWALTPINGVNPNTAYQWNVIYYHNGIFIVHAYNHGAATSTDGINWNLIDTSHITSGSDWIRMRYGNGKFVMISYNSYAGDLLTSPDGINWAYRDVGSVLRGNFYDMAFGNGIFVAVSIGPAGIAHSTDGDNWTFRNLSQIPNIATNFSLYNIGFGNGVFVMISRNTACAAISEDGINWEFINLDSSCNIGPNRIEYGAGVFVAIGGNAQLRCVGDPRDPTSWSKVTINVSASAIAFGNGTFVLATTIQGKVSHSVESCFDSKTRICKRNPKHTETLSSNHDWPDWGWEELLYYWKTIDIGSTGYFKMAYGNDTIVAINNSFNKIIYSKDEGLTWTEKDMSSIFDTGNKFWKNIEFINDKFILNDHIHYTFLYSTDGINWIVNDFNINPGAFQGQFIGCMAHNGDYIVGLNTPNRAGIVISTDNGATWQTYIMNSNKIHGKNIAYGAGVFVTLYDWNDSGSILYSTTGVSWQTISAPRGGYSQVCFGDGVFISINNNSARMIYSYDGINWEEDSVYNSISNADFSITFNGGNTFIAVDRNSNKVMKIFHFGKLMGFWWTRESARLSGTSVVYVNDKCISCNESSEFSYSHIKIGSYQTRYCNRFNSCQGYELRYYTEELTVSIFEDLLDDIMNTNPQYFDDIANNTITANEYLSLEYYNNTTMIPLTNIQSPGRLFIRRLILPQNVTEIPDNIKTVFPGLQLVNNKIIP